VKDALVVPAAAVVTAADGSTAVMVAGSDGKAHQKAVKLGIRQDDDVQILEGVHEGDRVVATGAYGLPDNTKIKIEAAPAESSKDAAKDASKDSSKDEPSEK
jgi:multidrug efflux pump subunit AcrA (membrane-fusion protein)